MKQCITTSVLAAMVLSMHKPAHPGSILREDVLPALGITVTHAAKQLGVTRITLSRLINEQCGLSMEMALRIECWLGIENGGSAVSWLQMQARHDLFLAIEKFEKIKTTITKAAIKVNPSNVGY